jgi:phosphonate transport system substrate-binding protein
MAMRKRIAAFLLTAFLVLGIYGLSIPAMLKHGISPSLPVQAAENTSTATSEGITYKFGVPPWQKGQSVEDIRSRYKPMLNQLTLDTGVNLFIVGANNYEELSQFLASGEVQLSNISPAPFVFAEKQEPGVKMLVTELSWNPDKTEKKDSYLGYIVTLKSREDINTLSDLKNKKFAFVTQKSTSGFQVPNALMRQQGINYKTYFEKVFFLDGHPRVTDAIVAGSVDAGATWDFNFEAAQKKHGDVFKIILTSPPIPNVGIAAHTSVPSDIQAKIQTSLVNMDPKLLEGLSAAGFVIRPSSFYDGIRQIVSTQ